jgi:amino acid adenylation domain-containing protein
MKHAGGRTGAAPGAPPAERLHDWVAHQARARPEATAVVLGEERWSYGGLDERSSRLARLLGEAGCRRGDRVALLASKSPAAVAAVLGVYKAEAVLVPLDAASPAPRLARILSSSGAACLLVGGAQGAARLAELRRADGLTAGLRIGSLGPARWELGADFSADDLARVPAGAPPCRTGPDDPAHVLYTSGSTGEPKGVAVTHGSVLRFVAWAVEHFGIGADERLSCHSPLHFDLSTFDLFGAFAAGAELHLVPPEANLLPRELAAFIRRGRLTQWFSVPSILAYLAQLDAVAPGDFPSLRRLLWCGEVFPTPALVHWMRRLPHVAFSNLYGPTETTIASSFHDLRGCPEDKLAEVPIGRPCGGEELLVLDGELRPAPDGKTGELYIGGAGLSPGYWRDPARTAAAFLPHPGGGEPGARVYRTGDVARADEEGVVWFLGRADAQIKSRGYRVEPGEIEAALVALGLTREAVVTAVPSDGFEGHLICCAYVPAAGQALDAVTLRRELARLLPPYMLPARWSAWDRLPRNAAGKLDRRRVRESFGEQADAAEGARAAG